MPPVPVATCETVGIEGMVDHCSFLGRGNLFPQLQRVIGLPRGELVAVYTALQERCDPEITLPQLTAKNDHPDTFRTYEDGSQD
jgi:hypothetical protein